MCNTCNLEAEFHNNNVDSIFQCQQRLAKETINTEKGDNDGIEKLLDP